MKWFLMGRSHTKIGISPTSTWETKTELKGEGKKCKLDIQCEGLLRVWYREELIGWICQKNNYEILKIKRIHTSK